MPKKILIEITLRSYQKIADGEKCGGDIAALDIPERFRWLTAVRSACIQASQPHTGFSSHLEILHGYASKSLRYSC